jgi:phenylpropionate dioxygenase-like ring-hydroxylating dioxygenase large terminal subunit
MKLIEEVREIANNPVETAVSLPFGAYSDPDFYEMEMEKVFKNDWVFVCNEGELANAGDYYAFTLADEPITVIRGKDGTLRAMSNVCRHRGTPLNDEGFGNKSRMVCPYHAWTYKDDGKLIGVSHPGNIEVKKEDHCLPQFKLESWHGLVFVNINSNAEPLAERYSGMSKFLKRYDLEKFTHGDGGIDEEWDTNWKLAIENGIESYHLFKVHKETLEINTPTRLAFYLEGQADWTLTAGELVDDRSSNIGSSLMNALTPESVLRLYRHYILFSLPPNFVGILIGDTLGYLAVRPGSAGKSYVRAGTISASKIKPGKDEQEFTAAFFEEDKWICERNQKSMKSKVGKPGKLVELERVVVDFHQYLSSRLFGTKPDAPFTAPEAADFID